MTNDTDEIVPRGFIDDEPLKPFHEMPEASYIIWLPTTSDDTWISNLASPLGHRRFTWPCDSRNRRGLQTTLTSLL
jgi:hypothetical protein